MMTSSNQPIENNESSSSKSTKTVSTFSNSLFGYLNPSLLSVLVLGLVSFLHLTSIYLFSQGFLLSRVTLADRSVCDPSSTSDIHHHHHHPCIIEPTHSKAIIILIDALRYDFLLPHSANYSLDPFNHNQLALPAQLTRDQPTHSSLFHFLADPPTTTLQRLKALTTGTLPTFIDIGSNFASTNVGIDEDSWLAQLHAAGKKIGFVGDDTWLKLFGTVTPFQSAGLFDPNITFGYESFNVEDLDTVDNGVHEHLFRILGIDQPSSSSPSKQDWDVLIGHFLGLDHAGHRFGASHPTVRSKLRQYDQFLEKIVDNLDDQTLLIVMGDHGMDSKGDHGGDSFSEVSSAIWFYSKTRQLVNPKESLPVWALDQTSSFIDLEPSLGRTRTVAQIDLVPTLSLMLGIPIPFSNLGMIIPEFFFRSTLHLGSTSGRARKPQVFSATETLSVSAAINSDQLSKFVERYAGSSNSPGQDLAQHVSELRSLYQEASDFSRLQGLGQEAFKSHRLFATSLLSICQRIWAKFIPGLMMIGMMIMALSLLVSWKLLNCIRWTTAGPHAPIRTVIGAGLSMGTLGLGIGLLSYLVKIIPDLSLLSSLATGSSLGISLGIITHQTHSEARHLDVAFKLPSLRTLFELFPMILHALALGSNSYTVWEDRVILYLISISVFLPVSINSFSAPQKRLRNRLLLFSLLFGVCVRLISLSTVCREEQHGDCSVTFYANSTSSSAPRWVMNILIPLALGLPIVPAWFLGISDSYRGPASFYFGSGWRLVLLCGVQYWIADYMISHEELSLTSSLVEIGSWIKMLVARVDIVLSLFGASFLWFILPLCIDIKRQQEPEEKEGQRPRLLVIGFANAYGSSYLMFLVAWFAVLFLVTQPVGQVVLSIGLVAILSLVEIHDSLVDVRKLKGSFQKAVESAAVGDQKDGAGAGDHQESEQRITETDLGVLIGLNFLGYLIFFGTGHQATFASIQWKTGFIGLESAHHLLSALLIGLNSFSGFVLVGLSLPLLKIWNLNPVLNLRKKSEKKEESDSSSRTMRIKLESEMMEVVVKFMSLQAILTFLNMFFILLLRRHLMVWKIFSPRFLLTSLITLGFDLLFLSVVSLGLLGLKIKVSRSFGHQSFI